MIREVTDKYSIARTDPAGRAVRSVDSVLRWTYGGLEAIQDGRRLRSLHAPLTMKSSEGKQISALVITEVLTADDEVREQYRQLRTGDLEQFREMGFPAGAIARRLARPLIRFNYLSIVGLLDPRLRELIGVEWSAGEQRTLERVYGLIRLAYRVLPDRLTYFPIAYHARKHHQQIQKMKKRELASAAYTVRPRQETPRPPITVVPG